MLFNSLDFAIFLPLVFGVYWLLAKRDLKLQNGFIVLASYLFYGWWDVRFLALIFGSTVIDYAVGRQLKVQQQLGKRRLLLWISIVANLGLLGFFKYYHFFLDNFIAAFSLFGQTFEVHTLALILPVGISFYTFQTLSYTIDVYRNQLEPTKDFIAFAAFVSFFPQLVAGPIERASNLLPQFYTRRSFQYGQAVDGLRQILWGLFKKIVIADNCAEFANLIFNHSDTYPGSTLLLGAFFFAFQIYGDFSGYSDIAIGTARLFGFRLKQNFAFPYFSRDIAEFWRRWHISLSTWFRDYMYIPLGGSRGSKWRIIRNVFIIFIVSGFWHGANWTFIAWGALNALFFLPLLLNGTNRKHLTIVAAHSSWPTLRELTAILLTFSLTVLAWIFFRADSIIHALSILREIGSSSIFTIPVFPNRFQAGITILLILSMLLVEWKGRHGLYGISFTESIPSKWLRYGIYYLIIFAILTFGNFQENAFIYFQF